jgi:hypothetical protein
MQVGYSAAGSAALDVESELRRQDPLLVPLFQPDFHTKNIPTRESMLRFNQVFRYRYPAATLDFFAGDLSEALTDAFHAQSILAGGVTENKQQLMALYLHDDNLQRSPSAHLFPQRVLSDELVLSLLGENYLLWAWDLTAEGSYDLLRAQMTTAGLTAVWETVAQQPREAYPLLVVVREPDRVVYVAKGEEVN